MSSESPTPSESPTASVAQSYLCQSVNIGADGSWAIYWDSSAGVWYASQREGNRVITANGTASLNGSTLSLSVTFSAWNYLDNSPSGLDLSVPFSDGSVRTYTFNASTIDSYNADTQKMNDQING